MGWFGGFSHFWRNTRVVLEIWPFSSGSFAIFFFSFAFAQDLQLFDQCKPWLAHRFRRQKGLNPSGFTKELSPRWKAVDHHVCKNDFNESFFVWLKILSALMGTLYCLIPRFCCFFLGGGLVHARCWCISCVVCQWVRRSVQIRRTHHWFLKPGCQSWMMCGNQKFRVPKVEVLNLIFGGRVSLT